MKEGIKRKHHESAATYIHRVGRTARADALGEAFTLVTPEDEGQIHRIEKAVGSKIKRVRLEGFEYGATAEAPLEVPRGERIKAIRATRAKARENAAKKAAKKKVGEAKSGDAETSSRPRRRRYGKRPD